MLERLRVTLLSATRSLAATPVPVLAAIITLAVAVGVNLAMFGLIDRAVLSPAEHVSSPSGSSRSASCHPAPSRDRRR